MLELNSYVSLNGKGGFDFRKFATKKRDKFLLPFAGRKKIPLFI